MPISDRECAALLAWASPRLGLREAGFTRVRKQVAKRIGRRISQLELSGAAAYRLRLEAEPAEWTVLDRLCRVTISRFWRDARAFGELAGEVLPELATRALARGARTLSIWSQGCASGEEPYSVALAWHVRLAGRFPGLALSLLATDASPELLERARRAEYARSSFRELPDDLARAALPAAGERVTLPERFRAGVHLVAADVRTYVPRVPFDLILCRNLVFTYFEPALQARLLARILRLTVSGGALMIGQRETLSVPHSACVPRPGHHGLFMRV